MKAVKADWSDMSDYVVHFTKPSVARTDYDNMMSICWDRTIRAANPFGIGRKLAPSVESQHAACFSEIPLHQLSRLAEKRGRFAIGFRKQLLVERGAGPVLYAYKGTPHHLAIVDLMKSANSTPNPSEHAVWKLTPFVEAPGEYSSPYYFEWEREWRHVGDFQFDQEITAFLIIPEDLHMMARDFFQEHIDDNTGPGYLCPYLDISWDRDRIKMALGAPKSAT